MLKKTVDERYYLSKSTQDVCHIPPQTEKRKDKYGQNFRLKCSCGKITNWHTDYWKAQVALNVLHSDIPILKK